MVKPKITSKLIAPCGMNCGICVAHLREKNQCPGCNSNSKNKPIHCTGCVIINCEHVKKHGYCHNCKKLPCRRLKQLDKRYSTKYNMSMLENLENIKTLGIRKFVNNEKARWKCPKCKGLICVHKKYCLDCKK